MSDQVLTWNLEFDLTGNGLGEAKEGMEGLGGSLTELHSGIELLKDSFGKLFEMLHRGFEMLDKFGDKAVDAFGERTSTIRAYTALLGDATKAQLEFGKAQRLSQMTPFLSSHLEAAQKQLFVAGMRN